MCSPSHKRQRWLRFSILPGVFFTQRLEWHNAKLSEGDVIAHGRQGDFPPREVENLNGWQGERWSNRWWFSGLIQWGIPWSELGNHTGRPGQLRFQNPKGGFPGINGEDLAPCINESSTILGGWFKLTHWHIGYPCELLCLPVFDIAHMWVMDVAWLHHNQWQSRSSSSSRILLAPASSWLSSSSW